MLHAAIVQTSDGSVADTIVLMGDLTISADRLSALGRTVTRGDVLDEEAGVTASIDIAHDVTWPAPEGCVLVAAPHDVQPGWSWTEAGGFVPPPATPAELAAYANAKQWALATGGYSLTLSGQALTFATDSISQGLIMGKYIRLAQPNPPATIHWQLAAGFVSVSSADFAHAAITIADFVQATFDAVEVVLAAIKGGAITTLAQIDAAAWPSPSSAG